MRILSEGVCANQWRRCKHNACHTCENLEHEEDEAQLLTIKSSFFSRDVGVLSCSIETTPVVRSINENGTSARLQDEIDAFVEKRNFYTTRAALHYVYIHRVFILDDTTKWVRCWLKIWNYSLDNLM